MVEMFFLALDYAEASQAVDAAKYSMGILRQRFGTEIVDGIPDSYGKVGLKLPPNLLYESIDPVLWSFCRDKANFIDAKFYDDPVGSERSIRRLHPVLPVSYFTIAAPMGVHMMRQHVRFAHELGMEVLAATAHTHMPPGDVRDTYNVDCIPAIYSLGNNALEAGCDGIVLDGEALKNPDIQGLPLKKLVTGIRLKLHERRRQSRITLLEEAKELKEQMDYAVVSSGYLDKPEELIEIFKSLL
ncbi:MAG: hypothetical protein J4400_01750 [Candidatus Aenigmarchaeota archaeon]|nr:hypothetical protein [Candidatus Aenigmarchaeota archaeon]